MSYVPNATTATEPIESRPVESAALEFRTLKEYVVDLADQVATEDAKDLRVPESTVNPIPSISRRAGKVLGFDAAGQPVAVAVAGAEDPSLRSDLASSSGSSLLGYIAAGTGAVATTVQTKLRERVSAADFGAVGDGSDEASKLQNFLTHCRTNNVKGFIPAGTYLTSSALDISGVDIEGVVGGFNNSDGTVIKGSGGHVILDQVSTSSANITYSIKNLRLRDGSVGLRMTYAVHCRVENLFITDCTDGIYCGVDGVLGPLWNNFKNCRVDASGVGLSIHGNDFANANIFDTCVFKGGIAGGAITCTGGIGAVANHFINTEFLGAGRGVTLFKTKSTLFDNCYFESVGPSVVVDGYTLDAALDRCTFGSLKNNNADGIPAFIWHKSGTCRVSVNGGYIYIASGTDRNNLRFVHSDAPASFGISMTDLPDQEIAASGWQVFGAGLPTASDRVFFSANYTPSWTTSGSAPSLGDGTLNGRYTLSGRICTAQIELVAGSATTFGTGQFQFSLPFAASSSSLRTNGIGRLSDAGAGFHIGMVEVNPTSSVAVIYSNNTANLVQSNSPFTWASGDTLRFTVTYEIAS